MPFVRGIRESPSGCAVPPIKLRRTASSRTELADVWLVEFACTMGAYLLSATRCRVDLEAMMSSFDATGEPTRARAEIADHCARLTFKRNCESKNLCVSLLLLLVRCSVLMRRKVSSFVL
jgi:hypothetical protein